jgi:hypothetical protein
MPNPCECSLWEDCIEAQMRRDALRAWREAAYEALLSGALVAEDLGRRIDPGSMASAKELAGVTTWRARLYPRYFSVRVMPRGKLRRRRTIVDLVAWDYHRTGAM